MRLQPFGFGFFRASLPLVDLRREPVRMSPGGSSRLLVNESSAVAQAATAKLASFFPTASAVRIPVQLTSLADGTADNEQTVIEFGTAREVLFACNSRLQFGDRLRLRNADCSFDVEVQVVAVQYHEGQTAVAARFAREFANWIIKT